MRYAVPIVATVTSGILYGLCFPVTSWQVLAWVALVPWLLALRRVGTGGALALAWLWTITAASTLGDWFPGAVASYYGQPIAVGIAFFVGVSTFMAAPYYMVFALAYRAVSRRCTIATSLVVAAAWVATELARARLVAGNPWGLFGYSQLGHVHLVQIADVAGVYAISFVLVAVNAAVASVWVAPTVARRRSLGGLALAAGVALSVWSYGVWRVAVVDRSPAGPPVRVAMVQGNLDVGTQWREELYGQNLDVYLRLTRDAVARYRPEIVFWPENALTFFLESEEPYRRAIAHVLTPANAEFVVGGPRVEGDVAPVYFNSIFLVAPDGAIRAVYDKQRLVPFAERFPFPGLEFLHRRFSRLREFTPGAARPPLPTRAGLAGVTICSEAMFPEIAAERVREGARYFVDPAHDTWLTAKFSAQQFDIVRLRTIEQRRYLVRASTSGPSAIVDPLGTVVTQTAFFTQTAIGGTITLGDRVTLYNRLGDAFAALCSVVACGAWVLRSRERADADRHS